MIEPQPQNLRHALPRRCGVRINPMILLAVTLARSLKQPQQHQPRERRSAMCHDRTTHPGHVEILALIQDRAEAVRNLEGFLRAQTTWLTAPASTRFHLCRPGGLLEHSVLVARTLLTLRARLAPDLSEESCVIVGLYHDLGKVGMPGQPYYLPVTEPRIRNAPYTVNLDLPWMDVASRSLLLIAAHVPISPEEAQAIRFHDGQYIEENRGVAHRECRLTLLLQYADNWAARVLEARGAD